MATPPPSLSSKTNSTISAAATTTEKPQPIPWTHQETIHLIQAYKEQSLSKCQLRSSQWEEVAVTVAARCGYNDFDPSKTSVQCRHKMEKLRQRYRAEKQRLSLGTASYWQYFDLMSNLIRGPQPISVRPMSSIPYDNEEEDQTAEKSDNYDTDEEEEEDEKNRSKSRSISHILRRPIIVDGSSSRGRNRNSGREGEGEGEIRVSGSPEKRSEAEEGDLAEEEAEEGDEGKEMYSKLAAEIRLFAERLVGMENTKLEMMKEAERNRMVMENKRIEMILESEQKIVNSIAKAFGSPKRLKIGQKS